MQSLIKNLIKYILLGMPSIKSLCSSFDCLLRILEMGLNYADHYRVEIEQNFTKERWAHVRCHEFTLPAVSCVSTIPSDITSSLHLWKCGARAKESICTAITLVV